MPTEKPLFFALRVDLIATFDAVSFVSRDTVLGGSHDPVGRFAAISEALGAVPHWQVGQVVTQVYTPYSIWVR